MLNKIYKIAIVMLLVITASSWLFAAKPYLVSPTDEATCEQKTVKMIWTSVATAEDYSIEISLNEDFTDIRISTHNISDTSYTAYLNYNTQYFWRVTVHFPYDDSETSSTYSLTTKQFPPVLHTPTDMEKCVLGTTEFTWFGDAINYSIQIAIDAEFKNLIVDSTNHLGTSFKYNFATYGKKYYWRVAGLFDGCTTEYSAIFSFFTPNLPLTLYSPEKNTIGIPLFKNGKPFNTSFVWLDSLNINKYRLQISANINFANPLIDIELEKDEQFLGNVHASRGIAISDMPLDYNIKYYWRVSSLENNCQSQWSSIFDFKTPYDIITGINPADDDECNSFEETFKWKQNNSTSGYRLQVFETADMLDTVFNQKNIFDTVKTVILEKPLHVYFWRVRAEDNNNIGIWANLKHFSTTQKQPNLILPENNTEGVILTVNFKWENLSNIERYYFQLSPDPQFDSLMIDTNELRATSLTHTFTDYNTSYYWRVKARHNQCYSPWSEVFTFETNLSIPILLSPENGANKQAVYTQMLWNAVEKAEYYYLEIATNKEFTENRDFVAYIKETNAMVDDYDFQELTTYYWRVRAHKGNNISKWSQTWSYRTGKYKSSIPILTSPINRSVSIPLSIELNWKKSNNVEEYVLQIFYDEIHKDTLKEIVLTDENFIVGDLKNYTTYFWRVRSRNIMGPSQWSKQWYFRTVDSAYTTAPKLILPTNNIEKVKIPAFHQWDRLDRAIRYNVQVSTHKDMSEPIEDIIVNSQTKYMYNLKYDSKYFWRVRAENEAGWGPWAEIWSYRTEADPVDVKEDIYTKAMVFPNPANNKAILSFTTQKIGNINLRIKSVEGKTIMNVNYYMSAGEHRIPIQTSTYPKGAYFFILKTNNKTETGRFIIVDN